MLVSSQDILKSLLRGRTDAMLITSTLRFSASICAHNFALNCVVNFKFYAHFFPKDSKKIARREEGRKGVAELMLLPLRFSPLKWADIILGSFIMLNCN